MHVGWDEGNAIEPFSSDFQACEDLYIWEDQCQGYYEFFSFPQVWSCGQQLLQW